MYHKSFKNPEIADGFIRLHLRDQTVVCARYPGRRETSSVDQAHSLLAHLGAQKTPLPARVRLVAYNGVRRDDILWLASETWFQALEVSFLFTSGTVRADVEQSETL